MVFPPFIIQSGSGSVDSSAGTRSDDYISGDPRFKTDRNSFSTVNSNFSTFISVLNGVSTFVKVEDKSFRVMAMSVR